MQFPYHNEAFYEALFTENVHVYTNIDIQSLVYVVTWELISLHAVQICGAGTSF